MASKARLAGAAIWNFDILPARYGGHPYTRWIDNDLSEFGTARFSDPEILKS
jgi:hypothetical protein